ncbi:FkbM family methyltransferase [Alloacidobacterium sp.]|uniref:FkbM family methyltransferase n=1 Tax=Alloacidobacterium sp. TaxID=2951999 RepID=UPI002D2E6AF8|nr:FkbM family methyltransferase [Alloacidobacterium sp.]HYK34378.1 FkbM family methyltransferase [Alloacidobacterium sp.]
MSAIKSFAKRRFHSFGYDVRRFYPLQCEAFRLGRMLETHEVNLVFDVGANIGQFAQSLRKLGYRGRIVSFEAQSEARDQLLHVASLDPLWEVAPKAAIGAEDGEIELHLAGNSISTSVLPMLDSHLRLGPDSKYVRTERVPLRRLDTIGTGYLQPDSNLFIKADVQGYEGEVLKGATGLWSRVVGLHLEMLFVPLYAGQSSYKELICDLNTLGFELWDLRSVLVDQQTGRMLWADAVFFPGVEVKEGARAVLR